MNGFQQAKQLFLGGIQGKSESDPQYRRRLKYQKGAYFEKYVRQLLPRPEFEFVAASEDIKPIPEDDYFRDFVFNHKVHGGFFVECKYRQSLVTSGNPLRFEWVSEWKRNGVPKAELYKQWIKDNGLPLYLFLGTGFWWQPRDLYVAEIDPEEDIPKITRDKIMELELEVDRALTLKDKEFESTAIEIEAPIWQVTRDLSEDKGLVDRLKGELEDFWELFNRVGPLGMSSKERIHYELTLGKLPF